MFIRVYLQPTFFTKKTRGMFINLHDVNYVCLEANSVHIYKQTSNLLFSQNPIKIPFKNHKEALGFYHQIQNTMNPPTFQPPTVQRWDRPEPDALAMAALEDYKPELK